MNLKDSKEFANFFGLNQGNHNQLNSSNGNSSVLASHFPHVNPQSTNHLGAPVNSYQHITSTYKLLREPQSVKLLGWAVKQNGENLDLASTRLSVTAPSSGSIVIGGVTTAVTAGQRLSPSELIALDQVLNGTGQTIVIASNGSASGGTVTVTAGTTRFVNLVLPKGVELIVQGSSVKDPFDVVGEFKDYGTLDLVAAAGKSTSIQDLITHDLYVGTTGLVTDSGSLDISANSVMNLGAITAGSLNLNAGLGGFTNPGTISSTGSLNINSRTGVFTNSGMIASTTGNILLNSQNNIVVNNTGSGTIQALQGDIDVRNASYNGSSGINLNGGNYLSQQLNLNSGTGAISLNVNNLTGDVNATGGSFKSISNTANLILGEMNITGDPLIYNTGNVTLSSGTYTGEPLGVVAGGNINGSTAVIDTSDFSSSDFGGGNITMIAGAAFTVNSDNSLTITGGDSTGGSITLNSLNTSATNSAGSVFLIAFAGSAANSGQVKFNSITANGGPGTGGGAAGADGNVLIYAGATSGTADWS